MATMRREKRNAARDPKSPDSASPGTERNRRIMDEMRVLYGARRHNEMQRRLHDPQETRFTSSSSQFGARGYHRRPRQLGPGFPDIPRADGDPRRSLMHPYGPPLPDQYMFGHLPGGAEREDAFVYPYYGPLVPNYYIHPQHPYLHAHGQSLLDPRYYGPPPGHDGQDRSTGHTYPLPASRSPVHSPARNGPECPVGHPYGSALPGSGSSRPSPTIRSPEGTMYPVASRGRGPSGAGGHPQTNMVGNGQLNTPSPSPSFATQPSLTTPTSMPPPPPATTLSQASPVIYFGNGNNNAATVENPILDWPWNAPELYGSQLHGGITWGVTMSTGSLASGEVYTQASYLTPPETPPNPGSQALSQPQQVAPAQLPLHSPIQSQQGGAEVQTGVETIQLAAPAASEERPVAQSDNGVSGGAGESSEEQVQEEFCIDDSLEDLDQDWLDMAAVLEHEDFRQLFSDGE